MPRWGWWRAGAIALLALLVAPALPGSAGPRALAHAQLVASSPGAGAVLAESPDELRLVFSEPLEAQVTSLDVVAQDGTALLDHAGEIDPTDPYALVVGDPQLPEGVYSLTWRSLSSADGHTAEGFFTFGIGDVSVVSVSGGGMTHEETDPFAAIGRWLTYIGLLLAVGVATFHRVVIRDGVMPRSLTRALAAGLGISAAATVGLAVISGAETGSVGDYLLGSRNGALQLARGAVAALGAAAMIAVPPRLAGAVGGGAGLIGIVLLVLAGHASALPGLAPLAGQVVHVVAAAVWIGGIASLASLQLRPALMRQAGDEGRMRRIVPRFSALALVSIGLVSLTGVYSAWVQTGTLVTTETEYGRTLIIKSIIAVAAFSLGGINYFDGGRMLAWFEGFRTRLTVEMAAALAILAVTAVLAATPPVEEVGGVPIEPIPDAFGSVAPGMAMQVVPGRPGVNRIVVATTDAMAASSGGLELGLDRLDDGSTTRIPLVPEGMAGMEGMEGMDHGAMAAAGDDDGTVEWIADAVVLPADSRWDTSVRIVSSSGAELSRQRFAFTVDEGGIAEGAVRPLLTPALGIAVVLVIGGAMAMGLGAGGMSLPRCEALASRIALLGGGVTAAAVGLLIGAGQVLG